jgi:hypothetical protein
MSNGRLVAGGAKDARCSCTDLPADVTGKVERTRQNRALI